MVKKNNRMYAWCCDRPERGGFCIIVVPHIGYFTGGR